MKRNRFYSTIALAALFAVILITGCVQGPTVVENPVHADHAVPLNEANFDSAVVRQGVFAIVEFYQSNCGTCRSMMWVIDSLAVLLGDSALVGAVDIDSNQALETRFGIQSIPSYLLFSEGEEIARRSYEKLDSTALDTLGALVRDLIAGSLLPDTSDTGGTDTTGGVHDSIIVNLDVSNFDSLVVRDSVLAVVEFYSPMCAGCQAIAPVFDSIGAFFRDSLLMGRVNADENDTLMKRYAVASVPTFAFFSCGDLVTLRVVDPGEGAFDTLASLVGALLDGTLASDTGSIDTTGGPADSIIINLDAANFDSLVVRDSVLAVVEFHSPMCAGCQAIAPVFDSIGVRFRDSLLMGRVNADENDTLMKRYAVASVPTFAFFSCGDLVTLRVVDPGEGAFDTLASLVGALLDGTLASDTADTADTVDTDYLTLNDSTFDTTVLRQGTVAMVFFLYAEGLPCIYMDSVVAQLVPFYEGRAIIAKLHAWDQFSTSAIAQRYGITSVPRYLFFKDSVLVKEMSGMVPGYMLADTLNRLLGDTIPGVPVQLDKNNFKRMVHLPGRVAMVDFFSPTCGACITMDSVVTNLANTFSGRALIGKVNASEDDSLDVAYIVQWLPTFIFFKDGVEYKRITGVTPEDTLAAYIERGFPGEIAKKRSGVR